MLWTFKKRGKKEGKVRGILVIMCIFGFIKGEMESLLVKS